MKRYKQIAPRASPRVILAKRPFLANRKAKGVRDMSGVPRMASLLLSDASDSKLVDFRDYTSESAQSAFLRFRLHTLARILFGEQLLISEGWALDSLVFLRVATEVVHAARTIRAQSNCPEGIYEFHPFVMETREDGNYADVMLRYLDRGDVRWSGFSPLRNDIEKQSFLASRIRETLASHSTPSGDLLISLFSEGLGREDVAEAIGEVADYFFRMPSKRTVRVTSPIGAFQSNLRRPFEFLKAQAKFNPHWMDTGQPLIRFADRIHASGAQLTNSSQAMSLAEGELEGPARDAAFHLINFAYMRVSAAAASSDVSAPALDNSASKILCLADELVASTRAPDEYAGKLDFEYRLNQRSPLVKRLASSDWRPIWESAIRLSVDPAWQHSVKQLGRDVYENAGKQQPALAETKQFRRLADLLEAACPSLVLRESGIERLGLRLSTRWLNAAGDVTDRAATAGAGHILAEFVFPGFGLIGAALGFAAKPLLPEMKRLRLNPFSREALWAKRSTVLHAMRKQPS